MKNIIMDLDHLRKIKILKQQLQEIRVTPFIEVADEVVSNCAVYPKTTECLVSVKYNPVLRSYSVDIDATSEEDVMRIIELFRSME